jgi:hypothetical protein
MPFVVQLRRAVALSLSPAGLLLNSGFQTGLSKQITANSLLPQVSQLISYSFKTLLEAVSV